MSILVPYNGSTYIIPTPNEIGWGTNLDNYLVAISQGSLQNIGGSFTLSNDADFGGTNGLKAVYYKTRSANIAGSGQFRLANAVDSISWRNFLNNADLPLTVNASNQLTFNGVPLAAGGSGTVLPGTANTLAYYPSSTNTVDTLPVITASRALISNLNGLPIASITTDTELSYVAGVTSDIQPQLDDKASIRLDNLDLTAINQSLIPDADGTLSIGSSSFQFNAFLKQATFSDTATFNGIIKLSNGSVGTPSLTFSTATTDGFYHSGGFIETVIGGVDKFEVNVTNIVSRVPHLSIDASAVQPSYAFLNDVSSGMYLIGFHQVGFATNSTLAFSINTSQQIDMASHKIINAADPSSNQDLATKFYVDTNSGKQTTGTYTGTGSAHNVSHSLGVAPSFTLIFRTDGTASAPVLWTTNFGSGLGNNSLATDGSIQVDAIRSVSSTQISLGVNTIVNAIGAAYQYMLWA